MPLYIQYKYARIVDGKRKCVECDNDAYFDRSRCMKCHYQHKKKLLFEKLSGNSKQFQQ